MHAPFDSAQGEVAYPDQSFLQKSWPYAAFLLFVFGYSCLCLADGFNATDEGYLQSLAQRIVDGELLYVDFYFFRPPMSLYLQAALLWLFGDNYTILAARWFWTAEMVVLCLLLTVLYRRYVSRWETFLLLCTSWVASTLLIAFPWYSYDAAFFAVAALILLHKRYYYLSGVLVLLAGMTKQNYLLLLPAFVVMAALFRWRWKKSNLLSRWGGTNFAIGFMLAAAALLWFLHSYAGGIEPFIVNVSLLPRSVSEISVSFAMFQNNPEALLKALPTVVAAVLLFWFSHRGKTWCYVTVLACVGLLVASLVNYRWFVYQLVFFNYAVLLMGLVRFLTDRTHCDRQFFHRYFPTIIMALVVQYLAGFNYSGLVFSYMGAAPGLVVGYLIWRDTSPSPHRGRVALALLLVIIGLGMFHKYGFVARDESRSQLETQFVTPKLAGIYSTERNVNQIEGMIAAVEKYTEPGDEILVFPDFPALYFLTGRKNPTAIDWYTLREFNLDMLTESIAALERHRPKVIMLQEYPEGDHRRIGKPIDYAALNRYRPFVVWLFANYKKLEMVGDVAIFVPIEQVETPVP